MSRICIVIEFTGSEAEARVDAADAIDNRAHAVTLLPGDPIADCDRYRRALERIRDLRESSNTVWVAERVLAGKEP